MSTKIKKEISIPYLQKIANEELENYIGDNLTEENLREMIQNQLDKTGKNIVFSNLGLEYDRFHKEYRLKSYGKFENIIKRNEQLINNIGSQVINEIISEVTPEDVLTSLTKKDKNELKKIYKESLMDSFEEEIRVLAKKHGEEHAKELFEKYLKDNEEN